MRPLEPPVYAIGFSYRKRSLLRRFTGVADIIFIRSPLVAPPGCTLLVWASGRYGTECPADFFDKSIRRYFVEDGFIRSVGLGAGLAKPSSWVIDRRGIYYDSNRPSELEIKLQSTHVCNDLRRRATALRENIISNDLTKYNVGHSGWKPSSEAKGRTLVLVAGQVETDASVRCSGSSVKTNAKLLERVRQMEANSWIVYKPHPDVVAGLRGPALPEDQAKRWCDEIAGNASVTTLLGAVERVHVMTSLTGFEALLRGKQVVCHGTPFYAGWGLTQDLTPLAARTRRLSLDDLVAVALLKYPTYVSRSTGDICEPEQAIAELLSMRNRRGVLSDILKKMAEILLRQLWWTR